MTKNVCLDFLGREIRDGDYVVALYQRNKTSKPRLIKGSASLVNEPDTVNVVFWDDEINNVFSEKFVNKKFHSSKLINITNIKCY